MRFDHDALQDIIRFLLLTFRYFSPTFFKDLNTVCEYGNSFYHCYTLISYVVHQKAKSCIKKHAVVLLGLKVVVCVARSAGRSKISADELVSKLEEGSEKWSEASLQVVRGLWSEHGASVHSQQEAQAMLSISQVCPTLMQ